MLKAGYINSFNSIDNYYSGNRNKVASDKVVSNVSRKADVKSFFDHYYLPLSFRARPSAWSQKFDISELNEKEKSFFENITAILQNDCTWHRRETLLETLKNPVDETKQKIGTLDSEKILAKLNQLHSKYPDNMSIKRAYSLFLSIETNSQVFSTKNQKEKEELKTLFTRFKSTEIIAFELAKRKQILQDYGFKSNKSYADFQMETDISKLAKASEAFLKSTDNIYWSGMKKLAYQLKPDRGEFVKSEALPSNWILLSYNKAIPFDKFEQTGSLHPVRTLMKTFNLDKDLVKQVHIDNIDDLTDIVKNKNHKTKIFLIKDDSVPKAARAFTYNAGPEETWVPLANEDIYDCHETAAHEFGHALHFAHTDPGQTVNQNILGPNSTTEAFANLFEGLFANKHWLQNVYKLTPGEAEKMAQLYKIDSLTTQRAYMIRQNYLCECINESDKGQTDLNNIYDSFISEINNRYGDKNLIMKPFRAQELGEIANYAQGYILGDQLEDYIKTNFGTRKNNGEDWYQDTRAFQFLKSLWKDGTLSPEEFSKRLVNKSPYDITASLKKYKTGI